MLAEGEGEREREREMTPRELDELKDQGLYKTEASELKTRVAVPRREGVWSGLPSSATSPFAIAWNLYT